MGEEDEVDWALELEQVSERNDFDVELEHEAEMTERLVAAFERRKRDAAPSVESGSSTADPGSTGR